MDRLWFALLLAGLLVVPACGDDAYKIARPQKFSGMSDASGGVALTTNLFIAASDEDNTLRVYDWTHEGGPIKELDCNGFLGVTGKSLEADLEAATALGNRIFWIGSHGRNKDGKERPNRCRLFATDFKIDNGQVQLAFAGRPCTTLLTALESDPLLAKYHLAQAATRAPKETDALNIEGLAATPQGQLLIGFRNPIPKEKALIVPLLNPNQVIEGQSPRLDTPVEIDLDDLGVRDIEWTGSEYLIIGGSFEGGYKSRLFHWKGPGSEPERIEVKHFGRYNPEAILVYPASGNIQILSDDGTLRVHGVQQKELQDPRERTFRSFWLEPVKK